MRPRPSSANVAGSGTDAVTASTFTSSRMMPPLAVLLAEVEAKVRRVVVLAAVNVREKVFQSADAGGPFVEVECEMLSERSELLLASVTAILAVLVPDSLGLSA